MVDHSQHRLAWIAFGSTLVLLTAIAVAPIWIFEFLPMQDFPQHLLLAQIASSFDDPSWNFAEFYRLEEHFQPYALGHLSIRGFALLVDVETAGKACISAYLLLMVAFVAASARARREEVPPWGLLLLIPLSFHQMYYLGFHTYLLSIPIVLIALRGHRRFSDGPLGWGTVLGLAFPLLLLWLGHPYAILVFGVLASLQVIRVPRGNGRRSRALASALVLPLILVVWYLQISSSQMGGAAGGSEFGLRWWPAGDLVQFALLPFTGMRIRESMSLIDLAAWIVALGILIWGLRSPQQRRRMATGPWIALAATAAGFLILPFWFGDFSYFNLRMLAYVYVFAVLCLALVQISGWRAAVLTVAVTVLVVMPGYRHQRLSAETAEILPLLPKMRPNARVLAVVEDGHSSVLDPDYFYQFHNHGFHYYHLRRGGGANPHLFPSPMLPIQYREGVHLPLPGRDGSLAKVSTSYDFLLIRDEPHKQAKVPATAPGLIGRTEHWLLFETGQRVAEPR